MVRTSERALLGAATLSFVGFLIVSGLAASPNADKFGFKNNTGDISNEFVTQVREKQPISFYFSLFTHTHTGNTGRFHLCNMGPHICVAECMVGVCLDISVQASSGAYHQ